jgi:hypothetical protein
MYAARTVGYKRKDYASGRPYGAPDAKRRYTAAGLHTVVKHREFIRNVVTGSTPNAFIISMPLVINPGINTSFPWLSGVASNFIQWKANYINVHYVSLSGEFGGAAGSTALGSVNMAVQYNSDIGSYRDKQSMLQEEHAVSGVPSRDLMLKVKCTPEAVLKKQYIRNNAIGQKSVDLLMYDLGSIYIAVDGCPTANTTLGELYIEYEIELFKPSASITSGTVLMAASGQLEPANDPLDVPFKLSARAFTNPTYAPVLPKRATIETNSVGGDQIRIPAGTLSPNQGVAINARWSVPQTANYGNVYQPIGLAATTRPMGWNDTSFTFTNGSCVKCDAAQDSFGVTATNPIRTQSLFTIVRALDVANDLVIAFALGAGGYPVAQWIPRTTVGSALKTSWDLVVSIVDLSTAFTNPALLPPVITVDELPEPPS